MSEAPAEKSPSPTCISEKCPTPPRSIPSPEATETGDLKISRKRGREVSLEPATPTASHDTDPFARERKHSSLPLKKNRRALDPTEEEEDNAIANSGPGSRSDSGSPDTRGVESVLTSPRREMRRKVRQISQGVEDISWKGPIDATTSDKDIEIEASSASSVDVISHAPTAEVLNGEAQDYEVCRKIDEEQTPPKTPEESGHSQSIQDFPHLNPDTAMQSPERSSRATDEAGHLRVSSGINDKGLKRKFLERGTSQGPSENGDAEQHPSEALKRPRDDADKDDNPRESKRPTPPPSPPRQPSPTKNLKSSGFMAYASNSSPFAAVKGQNIFSSSKVPTTSSPIPPKFSTDLAQAARPPSTTTAPKRSGFEAFASSASPFASVTRTKSPVLGSAFKLGKAKSPPRRPIPAVATSAFASYAGSNHGFIGLSAHKRQRADSPNGSGPNSPVRMVTPVINVLGRTGGRSHSSGDEAEGDDDEQPQSFSEKLRAAKDDEDLDNEDDEKLKLTEQDVATGEEDEETIHQVRGKLFSLHGSSWKERGTGVLRLNVKQEDGTGARLVMRKDAVYTLLLNVTLFPGMRCTLAQDPRYMRFSAIENGVATTYNLKLADAKVAQDLLEEINANIPTA